MTWGSGVAVALGLCLLVAVFVSPPPSRSATPPVSVVPAVSEDRSPATPVSGEAPSPSRSGRDRPTYTDANQAGIAAYAGGDYQDALTFLSQAVMDDSTDAEAHSNLGQVLARLGRHEEALARFEQAVVLNPSRWAYHFNAAHTHAELGRWDRAVEAYRTAADLYPGHFATHYNLGRALHEHRDDEEAVQAYLAAIALNPNDATFYLSLGVAYEALRRWEDAVAAYQQHLSLEPDGLQAAAVHQRVLHLTAQIEVSQAGVGN